MHLKPALAALMVATLALPFAAPAFAEQKTKVASERPALALSKAALATAVKDKSGKAVGVGAYEAPADALLAGDMAAFLLMLDKLDPAERDENPMFVAYLALDRAAAGDVPGAREKLKTSGLSGDDGEAPFYVFIDAWLMAMEGKTAEATERHREASSGMPGLTGGLSLAAMLEALGRNDEALAVYTSLTPARIEAPAHQFDPQIIVYSHVQRVVQRHALLLQRLGRIDEAKAVYKRLADAEPEEQAYYKAALESLETGKKLDNKALNVRSAFARSLSDVSNAQQEQRILRILMLGGTPDNFDENRAAFDQAALLIYPEDEGLRSAIIGDLYRNAEYDGVAHVARSAPKATSALQIAAAQALIMAKKDKEARAAIDSALKLTTDDERLGTLYGALQLRTMLGDEPGAYKLITEVIKLSENDAEKASAYAVAAETYSQFGEVDKAVENARKARAMDDTHERRIALVDVMGRAGLIDEATKILQSELQSRQTDPYMLNTYGYFLITRTTKTDEGFKLLFRARGLAERDPYIADSLGWAYYKLGDLKSAARLIEESQREILPHRNWEIESHLGDIYWHQGEQDKARTAWKLALENTPPLRDKREIEDKLAKGLTTPRPPVQPIPKVDLDEEEVNSQDI